MKEIMQQLPFPPEADESRRKHMDQLKEIQEMKDKVRRHIKMQEMLRQRLDGKRYFIVLDDVWEQKHWERLKNAFPADEQGETSRLLFTSRNKIITEHIGYVHTMKPFNKDESWELLLKTAFNSRSIGVRCPQELEDIGGKILEKCHGLPLAIAVAGGLLAYQGKSKTGWEGVLKHMENYHLDTSEIGTSASAVLELSYHNLPSHLKPCFLCLAFFKEDEVIRVRKLVHIWVALGLVQGEKESAEEIARGYLDELINRNLILVKSLNTDDGVKYCVMHDLLRELSIKKAKAEIGFEILISENEGHSSSSSYKPRHRVVRGKGMNISTNGNKHLRALFLNIEDPNNAYFSTPSNWKGYDLLRILDIESSMFMKLPSNIRASIGIRNLRLREKTSVLRLPRWLDELKNLEILDVGSNEHVEFPNVTWKMDSLRHFYIHSYCTYLSDSMKKSSWSKLTTIKCMRADNVLAELNCRLRKLGIGMLDGMEAYVGRFLVEKQVQVLHLRWVCEIGKDLLTLNFDNLTKLKLNGPLPQFLSIDKLPQNITHLTLSNSEIISSEVMQELSKLPNLLVLKLDDVHLQDHLPMEVLHEGFPSLRVLHLMRMLELVYIEMKEDGMPELQRVEIYKCPCFQIENLRNRIKPLEIIIKDDYF